MRRLRFAAALLVLGLCGCGPHAPLELGVQEGLLAAKKKKVS